MLRQHRTTLLVLSLVVGLLAAPLHAHAQTTSTGSVAGTVTDGESGAAMPDVCVDALGASGELLGRGFTDPSGRYTIERLRPGGYTIRFNGCPNDRRTSHTIAYWNGARTVADATPVDVAAGTVRARIDARLIGTPSDGTRYVSLTGRDTTRPACAGGSQANPWRTIEHGMRCLQRGETLHVRGGTYRERVLPVLTATGTAAQPITVAAHPGERVVVQGLIRLEGADHWVLDGINVTNDGRPYDSGEYLVKFRDGVGWIFRNAEVWDAGSYAAVRVESSSGSTREPADWRITGSCIANTRATHGPYQDHNLYVSTSLSSGPGRIDRNLLFGAPNGQNIKLGGGSETYLGAAHVAIEFNTMWNAVQNVLASGRSHHLTVQRNILGGVRRAKSWYPAVRGFELSGDGNVVRNNVGSIASGARFIHSDASSTSGWRDLGGNRMLDPLLSSMNSCAGFRTGAAPARHFGRHAIVPPSPSTRVACPVGEVPDSGFRDVQGGTHAPAIDCTAWRGVVSGVSAASFQPARTVDRGQMAAFLARALTAAGVELPTAPPPAFADTAGHVFRREIDQLAAIGVIRGAGGGAYRPGDPVSRAAMATFLVNARRVATGTDLPLAADWFDDDRGSTHERSINAATSGGLVTGTGIGTYAPSSLVRRDQMATFLARLLDTLLR